MPTVFEQLERYAPAERPAAVVHALRQLARRAGHDLIVMSRLAHEAHKNGYWSKVSRPDGEPYLSEEEFFAEVLQVQSWRTAFRRIQIGRAIEELPEASRDVAAGRLAAVGVAKASALAPLLEEKPEAIEAWIQQAETMPLDDLQAAVSDALRAKPRGQGGASEPKDRVLGFLTSVMPDMESRALLADFLREGHRIGAGDTTLGILLSAMRECVAQWSPTRSLS